jgi:hypothetical protein
MPRTISNTEIIQSMIQHFDDDEPILITAGELKEWLVDALNEKDYHDLNKKDGK